MKRDTNSFKTSKLVKNEIGKKLENLGLLHASKASGFVKRKGRKISPSTLITSLFICLIKTKNVAFSTWALELSILIKDTVSKQAISKRMGQGLLPLLKILVQNAFKALMEDKKVITNSLFKDFHNVYLQDSTSLKLPDCLKNIFPGNKSRGKKKSVAKIQAVYNLKSCIFKRFSLTPFTDNDQKESPNILNDIKKGDLVIRDLGYFVLDVFTKISEKDAFYLSRLIFKVNVYDANKKVISLLSLVRSKSFVDKEVFLGNKKFLPVRLIAIKVPDNVAEKRRRQAKNNRDKRLNHSKEYMELLGWTIYITNVGKETWSIQQVHASYEMRWFIEIIFKSWKSYFAISKNLCVNKISAQKAQIIIYSFLLFVLMFQIKLYSIAIFKWNINNLSLMKLSKFLAVKFDLLMLNGSFNKLEQDLKYYCVYEHRNKRQNMLQKLNWAA